MPMVSTCMYMHIYACICTVYVSIIVNIAAKLPETVLQWKTRLWEHTGTLLENSETLFTTSIAHFSVSIHLVVDWTNRGPLAGVDVEQGASSFPSLIQKAWFQSEQCWSAILSCAGRLLLVKDRNHAHHKPASRFSSHIVMNAAKRHWLKVLSDCVSPLNKVIHAYTYVYMHIHTIYMQYIQMHTFYT